MKRPAKAPKPVQHHVFADSGYTDGTSKQRRLCAEPCWQPEDHPAHQLPETTPEAQALDARVLGETKEHQPT